MNRKQKRPITRSANPARDDGSTIEHHEKRLGQMLRGRQPEKDPRLAFAEKLRSMLDVRDPEKRKWLAQAMLELGTEVVNHLTKDRARYLELARPNYDEGTLEIDANARVSIGTGEGAYVEAWLWIPNPDFNDDSLAIEPDVTRP